jgi:hypothetical protein
MLLPTGRYRTHDISGVKPVPEWGNVSLRPQCLRNAVGKVRVVFHLGGSLFCLLESPAFFIPRKFVGVAIETGKCFAFASCVGKFISVDTCL